MIFRSRLELAALSAFLLSGAATQPADWPQFRGPNRDGVWSETGILSFFPPGGPKILWRKPVGWGWSSPAIAQGRVCITDVELRARLGDVNFYQKHGIRI